MNPFEALAELASTEEWCWDIRCTTCGHSHFRYALREISRGKTPGDSGWVVHQEKSDYRNELGPIPTTFTSREEERILAICSKASLAAINVNCSFPDWLGYLGLVLHHMQPSTNSYKALSRAWAKQLLELVSPHSNIKARLKLVADGNSLLSLSDLEAIERSHTGQ